MSTQDGSPQPPDFDFDSIQAAMKETERGRWFLSEYERRSRTVDTQALLEAIGKLNKLVQSAPVERRDRLSSPGAIEAIRQAKAEIEAVQIASPPGATYFSRQNPFGSLKVEARSLAVEVSQLCEVMQQTLDQEDDPEGLIGAMTHVSQRLSEIGTLQCHFADRMARAIDLLVYLDREIDDGEPPADMAARLEKLIADVPQPAPALNEDNLKFFCKDEELFAATAEKASDPSPIQPAHSTAAPTAQPMFSEVNSKATDAAAKARIVIVRTPSTAANPIPLADGSLDPAVPPAA